MDSISAVGVLAALAIGFGTQPIQGRGGLVGFPRVAASRQPFALLRNAFGVREGDRVSVLYWGLRVGGGATKVVEMIQRW